MADSSADRFVKFLQAQYGQRVRVPAAVTDVMRVVRFPGLESRKPEEPAFDPSGYTDMGNPMAGGAPQEPAMPEALPAPLPGDPYEDEGLA